MSRHRGGRPRKPPNEKLGAQIALRVNPELLALIDRHVRCLMARSPAAMWTRGSAIREVMLRGLATCECAAERADGGNFA